MSFKHIHGESFAAACCICACACSADHERQSPDPGGAGSGGTGGSSIVVSNSGQGPLGGTSGASNQAATGCTAAAGATPSQVYANVTEVSVAGSAGTYVMSVSVESSDIDCGQYANWWEVLDETGSLLYRKVLNHCHTDENGTTDPGAPGNTFTRSSDPDIVPLSADQVAIVRAHMNAGGYCGMAMRGTANSGFVDAPDIRSDFAADVETRAPQPTACLF